MIDEHTRLRLNIDGRWSAVDMSACFAAMNDLYSIRQILHVVEGDVNRFRFYFDGLRLYDRITKFEELSSLRRAYDLSVIGREILIADRLVEVLEPFEQLQVFAIRFGSEGFQDFTGLGSAIGHVKDLVIKLIEVAIGQRKRRLEEDGIELENHAKRLKIARDHIEIARDLGYSEMEIRKMIYWIDERQLVLVKLAQEGKLIGVDEKSKKDGS